MAQRCQRRRRRLRCRCLPTNHHRYRTARRCQRLTRQIALVRYELIRYKALHARQLANRLIPAEDAPQHASDDSDNSTSGSDANDSDDDVAQHAQHASRTRNTHTPSVA
jgi:hypothetical protein